MIAVDGDLGYTTGFVSFIFYFFPISSFNMRPSQLFIDGPVGHSRHSFCQPRLLEYPLIESMLSQTDHEFSALGFSAVK